MSPPREEDEAAIAEEERAEAYRPTGPPSASSPLPASAPLSRGPAGNKWGSPIVPSLPENAKGCSDDADDRRGLTSLVRPQRAVEEEEAAKDTADDGSRLILLLADEALCVGSCPLD